MEGSDIMAAIPLLYHYCAADKFESIIESQTIWLTNIVKSNDREETVLIYKSIWPKIYKKIIKAADLLDEENDVTKIKEQLEALDNFFCILSNNENNKLFDSCLGVCLSKNRDLAQNWNEYGDRSRGVALGFSEDLVKDIQYIEPCPSTILNSAIGWKEVKYNVGIEEQLAELFIQEMKENPMTLYITVMSTLKHYSAFIKHYSFIDEREVRIIYYPNKEHKGYKGKGLLPLCTYPQKHASIYWNREGGKCALKEIIIGTNCPLKKEDIERKLGPLKDDVSIIKSEYPYQLSKNKQSLECRNMECTNRVL